MELRSPSPHGVRQVLDGITPMSDPVRQLETGHEYRITLKPRTVWSFAGSKKDLFNGKSTVDFDDLSEGALIKLESKTELRLKLDA